MKKENKWYPFGTYWGEDEGFTSYPEESGNYAIYALKIRDAEIKKILLYIGTASNLKKRTKKHAVINVFLTLGELFNVPYRYYFLKFKIIKDTKERYKQERKLINRLKPIVNVIEYNEMV